MQHGHAEGPHCPRRYVSNTRIKFILVVDEPVPKDEELRTVGWGSLLLF